MAFECGFIINTPIILSIFFFFFGDDKTIYNYIQKKKKMDYHDIIREINLIV